jgi:hypothetical protein
MQPLFARTAPVAFVISLIFACVSSDEHLTENDFVFQAPKPPFKFIDLPEPCVGIASFHVLL